MDQILHCNFYNCRKQLEYFAWVTLCSHIFCDEHGPKEFAKSLKCPACSTELDLKKGLVRLDLNPCEKYKSMVLAGRRPEQILEIGSRALSFWMYQTQQEINYQETVVNKNNMKCYQMEQYKKQTKVSSQQEIDNRKQKMTETENELETLMRKENELSEKIMDSNRRFQKLRSENEALKLKVVQPQRGTNSGGHMYSFIECGTDALQRRSAQNFGVENYPGFSIQSPNKTPRLPSNALAFFDPSPRFQGYKKSLFK